MYCIVLENMRSVKKKQCPRRTKLQFDKQSEASRFNPIKKLIATHVINLSSSSFRALKMDKINC